MALQLLNERLFFRFSHGAHMMNVGELVTNFFVCDALIDLKTIKDWRRNSDELRKLWGQAVDVYPRECFYEVPFKDGVADRVSV